MPLDLGAGRRGVDMGPSAFRVAEIHARVRSLGYEVADRGDIDVYIQETHDPGDPRMKYLREIRQTCEGVRDEVDAALGEGALPVVLGGDHSIAMGTIAGVSRHFRLKDEQIGLVWFDAHGDMNTPETSPSGNIHGMPLAVALGIGEESLVGLAGDDAPWWTGRARPWSGCATSTPRRARTSSESGIGAFTMRDIDERGMRAVMEEAIKRATSRHRRHPRQLRPRRHRPRLRARRGHAAPGVSLSRGAPRDGDAVRHGQGPLGGVRGGRTPSSTIGNTTAKLGVELLASLLERRFCEAYSVRGGTHTTPRWVFAAPLYLSPDYTVARPPAVPRPCFSMGAV